MMVIYLNPMYSELSSHNVNSIVVTSLYACDAIWVQSDSLFRSLFYGSIEVVLL